MTRVIAQGVNGDAKWTLESVSGFANVPYYKETNGKWEEVILPGDPYHMKRYLKRGFKLERPSVVEQEPVKIISLAQVKSQKRPKKLEKDINKEKPLQLSFL
tara:strand:- start:1545 stop:1850 length:306 start_codon:yes stop_codon:yes gene_type:complete